LNFLGLENRFFGFEIEIRILEKYKLVKIFLIKIFIDKKPEKMKITQHSKLHHITHY